MKAIFWILFIFQFINSNANSYPDFHGQQPQASKDVEGNIRIVYGRSDSILCITSKDNGETFSKETLVGVVKGMHLGMARGPQIASSNKLSLITAMNKEGNILFFTLKHKENKWSSPRIINDKPFSAPEGLMNVAADKNDNFYAVWLDTRIGKTNNICFSKLTAGSEKWRKNTIVYISPDKLVCECCRPSIAVNKNDVTIMFRNWLNESRDLYVINSKDFGDSFSKANKLGEGTWKLNGCPMDGGGLAYNSNHGVSTVWRRKNELFYFAPGGKEQLIGGGRNVSISEGDNSEDIAYTENGEVKFKNVIKKDVTTLGKGDYLKLMILKNKTLCVWQQENTIKIKMI
ncbi:MAG: hypothetical protein NVSMB45_06020 [Ginsengibacter sp.]